MTDVALVRRVIAGDEAAFDEFFTVYFPRLYRFALPRLGGERGRLRGDRAGGPDSRDRLAAHLSGRSRVCSRGCVRCADGKSDAGASTQAEPGRSRSPTSWPDMRAALELVAALQVDDPDSGAATP